MNDLENAQINRVRTAVDADSEGEPWKDHCDMRDVLDVVNTLLIILDTKLPDWQETVQFDDDGFIVEP